MILLLKRRNLNYFQVGYCFLYALKLILALHLIIIIIIMKSRILYIYFLVIFILSRFPSNVPTAAKYPLPQRWQILRKNFLKLLIGSQHIIEGRSLICGGRGKHNINLGNPRHSLRKICHLLVGKGYFTANRTCAG